MAEYATTTTTTTEYTTSTRTTTFSFNLNYLTSVPGILKICEIVCGLLCWSLTASFYLTPFSSAHQFVMFVSVTAWITTIILFIIYLAGCHATQMASLPWAIIDFGFNTFWSVLYFIAACVSAANTWNFSILAAASAFAFITLIFYVIDAVIAFRHWQGGCSCTVTSARGGNTVDT